MRKVKLVLVLVVLVAVALIAAGLWVQQGRRLATAREQISYSAVLIQQGEVDKGIAGLERVIESDPGLDFSDRARALRQLARACEEHGHTEKAIKTYERLIQEDVDRAAERTPDSEEHVFDARVSLARLLVEGDPRQAIRHCETVRNSNSRNRALMSRALLILGLAHRRLGEGQVSAEYLNKAIREFGDTEAGTEARGVVGEMNMERLVSPDVDEQWSAWYTVKPGDSLFTIAKAYNTTVEYLQRANRIGTALQPRVRIKVPTVALRVRVDKSDFALDLLTDSGEFIKRYPVGIGRISGKTRAGEYVINTKEEGPRWRDPETGRFLTPQDPEYPLGTRWLGLGPPEDPQARTGLGIHGTNQPETVGTASSAGCVRMLNHDVEELYNLLVLGTKVEIQE